MDKLLNKTLLTIVFLGLVFGSCNRDVIRIKVDIADNYPQVLHGLETLKYLENDGLAVFTDRNPDFIIQAEIDTFLLKPEAFQISNVNGMVTITGGDPVGVMYALLDIKEQLLSADGVINSKEEEPRLTFRALKYNLPWHTYRSGESMDLHDETCRDTLYWRSFLDMMAENRLNVLTLWSMHPFNYMVKTEKYPEATSFTDDEMAEWQQFWHALFRMAKDRGIETYLVNWNIFVSPEFAKAHNVSPISIPKGSHFGDADTSEIIKDYMREVVRDVIDTYPDLTGLGITLGEGMGGITPEERAEWLHDAIIAGVRQASRRIKFIHRAPLTADRTFSGTASRFAEELTRETLDTLTCFDGFIKTELKFNWSHGFSTPHLVKVHGGELTDAYWNPMPTNYRMAWMIRNEDFFILRWGQPEFIRQHIALNAHPYVNGYYIGSESYIPAKDYITSLPDASYDYAFERQWMLYKMWGRLMYNPETPDDVFVQAFEKRFPGLGNPLYEAQTRVSRIPLIIASYWDAWWDFTLYSEGMQGFNDIREVKLLSMKTMGTKVPMAPDYMGIPEFLENENVQAERITPFELADSIDSFCLKALELVANINTENNVDLLYEVSDIKTWANLGMYFSTKLRAAIEYQKFLNTNDQSHYQQAVQLLELATTKWDNVVEITTPVYEPVPLMHFTLARTFRETGDKFHWSIVAKEVEAELEWLKSLEAN